MQYESQNVRIRVDTNTLFEDTGKLKETVLFLKKNLK